MLELACKSCLKDLRTYNACECIAKSCFKDIQAYQASKRVPKSCLKDMQAYQAFKCISHKECNFKVLTFQAQQPQPPATFYMYILIISTYNILCYDVEGIKNTTLKISGAAARHSEQEQVPPTHHATLWHAASGICGCHPRTWNPSWRHLENIGKS